MIMIMIVRALPTTYLPIYRPRGDPHLSHGSDTIEQKPPQKKHIVVFAFFSRPELIGLQ